jgi:predicted dehydrogenase
MSMSPARPFRWAILGTGAVSRKFALDLKGLGEAVALQAVASRTPENARRFAADLGVAEVAEDYAAAAQADVDALYIATPPALHEDHALMGIAAGRAVLIEKPFALDAAAADRIRTAARAAGVFCMEAMWTRFQPLPLALRALIAEGRLGELRSFEGRFLAANIPDAGLPLFDPEQGGGALMHRGIYPLSLARFLMGPVRDVQASAHLGETGVDEDSMLVLTHDSGALSLIHASLRTGGAEGATVYGTKGTLQIEGPLWRPTGAVLRPIAPASARPGGVRRFEAFRESGTGLRLSGALNRLRGSLRRPSRISAGFEGNGYRHEAQALMQAVAAGQRESDIMPLDQSVELMQVIDRARAAWTKGAAS